MFNVTTNANKIIDPNSSRTREILFTTIQLTGKEIINSRYFNFYPKKILFDVLNNDYFLVYSVLLIIYHF